MKFHRGRLLGLVMGLVILFGVFFLPFGSGSGAPTFYNTALPLLQNLGGIQSSGSAQTIAYDYILVVAFILLVIAGVVGIFPLATSVLGIVSMGLLTAAPSMIYPNGPVTLSIGTGFIVLWVASIIALGAVFWHESKKPKDHF